MQSHRASKRRKEKFEQVYTSLCIHPMICIVILLSVCYKNRSLHKYQMWSFFSILLDFLSWMNGSKSRNPARSLSRKYYACWLYYHLTSLSVGDYLIATLLVLAIIIVVTCQLVGQSYLRMNRQSANSTWSSTWVD